MRNNSLLMDGSESVRSGRSDRSERSRRSNVSSHHRNHHNVNGGHHSSGHRRHHGSSRSRDRDHRDRSNRDREYECDSHRDDRSVTINAPNSGDEHNPEERIEVQILPQDDNWGDNTTAITGNTSETGFSVGEEMHKIHKEMEDNLGFDCAHYIGTGLAAVVSLGAFASPIAMVALPKLNIDGWQAGNCAAECEGLLISFAFKLLILFAGTVALFLRHPKATMPRIFVFRCTILFLVFILTFAFWLFYGVRIFRDRDQDYYRIVQYSVSLVDALLFIHYLAIIFLEIRQLQTQFVVRVVRSPDGESRCYNIGMYSIQRAAVWVLEQYYRDFPNYNPYLDNAPRKPSKLTGLKFYDVDGPQSQTIQGRSRAIFAAAARRRDSSHNDRFYEEQEFDRRVMKRKARLLVAAEEAFTHIKRMQEEPGPAIPMDPYEAAQAVFPSMARALQKYLRITRQQPKYSMESVLRHLSVCISHDMSPRAFIEKYLTQGKIIQNVKDNQSSERWILVCDQLLTREIEESTIFQLRQGDLSILCSFYKMPHFSLTEAVIDPKSNKFVLRLNSETSV